MNRTELKKAILELVREDEHFAILLAEELSPALNEMIRVDVTRSSYDDFGNGDGAISELDIDFDNGTLSAMQEYIRNLIQKNFQDYYQTIFAKNKKMFSETRDAYFEYFNTYVKDLNPNDIGFVGELDIEFLKVKTKLENIQKVGQQALKEQEKGIPVPYFIRILNVISEKQDLK